MILAGATANTAEAGGKGQALARASAAGFAVPPFFVVPSGGVPEPAALADALEALGPGPYAVRSSGLAEDGAEASHAGQFESLLNVPAAAVSDAIAQVAASGSGEGLAAYRNERGIAESAPPAVVVQRMIPADHAGVAFPPIRWRAAATGWWCQPRKASATGWWRVRSTGAAGGWRGPRWRWSLPRAMAKG